MNGWASLRHTSAIFPKCNFANAVQEPIFRTIFGTEKELTFWRSDDILEAKFRVLSSFCDKVTHWRSEKIFVTEKKWPLWCSGALAKWRFSKVTCRNDDWMVEFKRLKTTKNHNTAWDFSIYFYLKLSKPAKSPKISFLDLNCFNSLWEITVVDICSKKKTF